MDTYQRTIVCHSKHCINTTRDHNKHYVSYTHNLSRKPQYCPVCLSTHIQSSTFSYVDYMCTTWQPMNTVIASALIEELNNQNSRRQAWNQRTIEDIMQQLPKPPVSNGICPLHVSCPSCKGTFSIIRTIPTAHEAPTYCIWCGNSRVVVTQYNSSEIANYVLNTNSIQALATEYNIPVVLMQALYDQWTSDSNLTFFSEFLSQPDAKLIIKIASSKKLASEHSIATLQQQLAQ